MIKQCIYLILSMCCISFLYANEAQARNGFYTRVGIDVQDFNHGAGSAKIDSVVTGLLVDLQYYERNIKAGGYIMIGGGGALSYRGENLPIISATNTEPPRKGSNVLVVESNLKVGYNIMSEAYKWEYPLYLNIVGESTQFIHAQADAIFTNTPTIYNLILELEGSARVATQTNVEYRLGVGYNFGYVSFGRVSNRELYNASFQKGGLYLSGSLGLGYQLRSNVLFFTRLYAKYLSVGRSESIFIPQDAQDTKLTTNAYIYYPQSYTIASGVHIGFEF